MRDGEALEVERHARNEVSLQVVQLELRGLADQLRGVLLVFHAGQLDDDLVAALNADLRLGDTGAVDSILDDRAGVFHALLVNLRALLRLGLLDDLEAALEVEAERWRLVDRRPRHAEQDNANQGHENEAHQNEVRTPLGHCAALG